MDGGLNTRAINWAGLHGIWSKERNHGIGIWGILYCVLYPYLRRRGESFSIIFITTAFFLLPVDEKEAPS